MTSTAAARTSRDRQPDTAGDASRYPAQVRSITWPLLADGYAKYQRQQGGDWSSFIAIAEQLTDDGWQPIEVAL